MRQCHSEHKIHAKNIPLILYIHITSTVLNVFKLKIFPSDSIMFHTSLLQLVISASGSFMFTSNIMVYMLIWQKCICYSLLHLFLYIHSRCVTFKLSLKRKKFHHKVIFSFFSSRNRESEGGRNMHRDLSLLL
jgi:hypothetical protein